MQAWLRLSRGIDALNRFFGRIAIWFIFAATVLSAGNAIVRKLLNVGSNAWLEAQWYLYAAAFMLAAALTLRNNEHVRIDILISRFSLRTQAWMDLFGLFFMLLPVCVGVLYFSIPFFWQGFVSGEMSSNSGGLDSLAGLPHDSRRFHAFVASGNFRGDQARRLSPGRLAFAFRQGKR